MKRIFPFIMIFVLCLLSSCEEDEIITFPESTWALTNYTSPQGGTMILSFYGDGTMQVQNANDELVPFNVAQSWSYQMTRDSILHISCSNENDSYTDDDGNYYNDNSDTYDLDVSLSHNDRTLALTYYEPHLFHHADTLIYTFVRR